METEPKGLKEGQAGDGLMGERAKTRTGLWGALGHGVVFDAHWLNDFSLSDLSQFCCNFCHFSDSTLSL